jgi:hypothetical protein
MKKWTALVLAVIGCLWFTVCNGGADGGPSDTWELTSVEAVEKYLSTQDGTDPNNPVELVPKIDASEWERLSSIIYYADKYVALDLSQCFNVPSAFSGFGYTGKTVSLVLPVGITSIGQEAFSQCTALREIDLPASLTSIGADAFLVCSSLNLVICRADPPPELLEGVGAGSMFYGHFYGTGRNFSIIIRGSWDNYYAYRAAWTEYTDKIGYGGA